MEPYKLNYGDWVSCTESLYPALTKGTSYKIQGVFDDTFYVKDDMGVSGWFSSNCFEMTLTHPDPDLEAETARMSPEALDGDPTYPKSSNGGSTDYYRLPEGATELGDLIEAQDMNFNVGNIFKAAYRLGKKQGNDITYDLNKIMWFVQRELDRLQ